MSTGAIKPPNAGKGRKKGVPNKSTADVRATIAAVAAANAPKVSGWLARVARKDPGRATDLYLRLIEYHIPKLSRQEIVKPAPEGRVIDSSTLTQEQREQLRRMILAQAEPAALEHQAPNVLEPVGLAVAQVVDSVGDGTEVRGDSIESQ